MKLYILQWPWSKLVEMPTRKNDCNALDAYWMHWIVLTTTARSQHFVAPTRSSYVLNNFLDMSMCCIAFKPFMWITCNFKVNAGIDVYQKSAFILLWSWRWIIAGNGWTVKFSINTTSSGFSKTKSLHKITFTDFMCTWAEMTIKV